MNVGVQPDGANLPRPIRDKQIMRQQLEQRFRQDSTRRENNTWYGSVRSPSRFVVTAESGLASAICCSCEGLVVAAERHICGNAKFVRRRWLISCRYPLKHPANFLFVRTLCATSSVFSLSISKHAQRRSSYRRNTSARGGSVCSCNAATLRADRIARAASDRDGRLPAAPATR
jgi:hypothetical protein